MCVAVNVASASEQCALLYARRNWKLFMNCVGVSWAARASAAIKSVGLARARAFTFISTRPHYAGRPAGRAGAPTAAAAYLACIGSRSSLKPPTLIYLLRRGRGSVGKLMDWLDVASWSMPCLPTDPVTLQGCALLRFVSRVWTRPLSEKASHHTTHQSVAASHDYASVLYYYYHY